MDNEKHGCCADGHWYMRHIKMSISKAKAKYYKFSLTYTQPLCELIKVEESFVGLPNELKSHLHYENLPMQYIKIF